jgi:hypothetical protein
MGQFRTGYGRRPSGAAAERSKRDAATRAQVKSQPPSAPFENVRAVGTLPRRLAREESGPINPRVLVDGVPNRGG